MKYLSSIEISEGCEYILSIRLNNGWKVPAKKMGERAEQAERALENLVKIGEEFLKEIRNPHKIGLHFGEYGLHHIGFWPDRIGLDLIPERDMFLSHNFTKKEYVYVSLPIVVAYLGDFDLFG